VSRNRHLRKGHEPVVNQFLTMRSDYTVSYHQLMRFLAKNFDQKSILRVVKSLAAFRPSLIALQ
jgi:hypothetical protein